MRLIVARCSVTYTGRGSTHLPEAIRLLMIKADGTFMIWSDGGGSKVKPLNWMTPPTVIEEDGDLLVVRKRAGKFEDRRDLQLELAAQPDALGEALRLVRREWPTDIGPVDLMCKDENAEWVAIEIKRVATIDAVEQLTRYLERIRRDPALGNARGILAAQMIKPQALTLAEARGIRCVEVDLELLRGEREPELTLFAQVYR